MIWFTLALFVISFLVVALLTPKPEFENARASTLDDVDFPRATEDAPIPLVLGRVRTTAPNVTWYGNFRSVPITEKMKTGLFSSTRVTVAHRYFLTMDLALAMGPGISMREVYVDDKLAWSGDTGGGAVTAVGGIGISFGGYKEGGAMNMGGNFYSGAFDLVNQPVDSIIQGLVGAGNVPAYLGTSHISLDGELGESAQLRKMAFVIERYTNSLGLINNGKIGVDINPAEALYQVMTDSWSGMGISPSLIDITTLQAIGQVLYNENNGISIQVTAEATGKKVVEEILRQIDGVAYQDPATGRIIFKLIRDDYDVDLLDIYDETSIIKVENFSRSGWDEVMAQVKVSFPQRDSDSEAVAISQDMATAGMVGRLRSTTISMPFCYDKELANRLASRERAQLSVPLFRMTLQMNRNANTLRPGDVFKVSWADYGIQNLVMRVQEFDFGSLLDGKIVVRCLQDNFALDTVVFSPPPETGWVAPVVDPQPIAVSDIIEMPRFFMNRVQFPIPDGNAGVIPLAVKPSTASSSYDLLAGDVSGDLDVREPQQVIYPASGTLLAAYDRSSGFATGSDATGFTLINITGDSDGFVAASNLAAMRQGETGLLYGNGEFIGFLSAIDNGNGSWTISNVYRGLLGTVPKTHPSNTRFYQIKTELMGTGVLDDLAEDDTLYYKLLDRVGPSAINADEIAEASQLMQRWARRGQRVRNVRLGGNRSGIVITDSSAILPVTWARSNREASEIAIETDADQVPDISDADTEHYDVQVYLNNSLVAGLSSTDVVGPTSHDIDFSGGALVGPGEIRVTTRWNYGSDDILSNEYARLPITFDQEIFAYGLPILGDGIDNAYSTGVWTKVSGAGTLSTGLNGYYVASGDGVWYQDIALPATIHTAIDAGLSTLYFEYTHYQDFADDTINVKVEFYDGSAILVGTVDLGVRVVTELDAPYVFFADYESVPVNARTARVILDFGLIAGSAANGMPGLLKGDIWLDLGTQLLVDNDFALADPAWVMVRSMSIGDPSSVHTQWNSNAPNLNYSLLTCGTDTEAEATQTVDVSAYSVAIDAGNANVSGLLSCIKTFGDGDFMDFDLQFLDATDTLISTDVGTLTTAPAVLNERYDVLRRVVEVPVGTRKVVFVVRGTLLGGSIINSIAYNSSLWIKT